MRESYATVSGKGLDWDSVPMRLFQKAKKLGTWDPQALDFSKDRPDWEAFTDDERDFPLRTLALFQAGEEGVTSDLLPLIMVVAGEGRLEEGIFLTSLASASRSRPTASWPACSTASASSLATRAGTSATASSCSTGSSTIRRMAGR